MSRRTYFQAEKGKSSPQNSSFFQHTAVRNMSDQEWEEMNSGQFAESDFETEYSPVSVSKHPLGIQAKLSISQPDDKYELEADRIAEQIMRMPEHPINILQPSETKNFSENKSEKISSDIKANLPENLKQAAQKARLHDNDFSHLISQGLHVDAFTKGDDIYFGKNRFKTDAKTGSPILRHELGHIERGEGRHDTIEAWDGRGHKTITRKALKDDSRYSMEAKFLLSETAPILDYNRPQVLQDLISFWTGEKFYRAPLGSLGGGILGSMTPPEQGTQIGSLQVSGAIPQAILGTGFASTVDPVGRESGRKELMGTRVPQELANHGEDLPKRNEDRMNNYVDQGISEANGCNLQKGLEKVGYALHVAQDRGSHGDGYTKDYVKNRPHKDIDNMTLNTEGVNDAIRHSRSVLDRFYNGLNKIKKNILKSPLLNAMKIGASKSELESIVINAGKSLLPDATSESQPKGINILTVKF